VYESHLETSPSGYSLYDKLGAVDQGAIVDNKRLGHVLQIVQQVQAQRDDRAVNAPSTAQRADGRIVPRHQPPAASDRAVSAI
jgi:hypothetical protein